MKPWSESVESASRSLALSGDAVQQRRHVARNDQLGIRECIHQEHIVSEARVLERHTDIEHRGLH